MGALAWPDNVKVAVNLSPAQFQDRNLVRRGCAALSASGSPADRLQLEIAGSVLLRDNAAILAKLREKSTWRPDSNGRFRHGLFGTSRPAQLPLRQGQD
jgi:predicted signal transduction protein with EAL and GGDEF domain